MSSTLSCFVSSLYLTIDDCAILFFQKHVSYLLITSFSFTFFSLFSLLNCKALLISIWQVLWILLLQVWSLCRFLFCKNTAPARLLPPPPLQPTLKNDLQPTRNAHVTLNHAAPRSHHYQSSTLPSPPRHLLLFLLENVRLNDLFLAIQVSKTRNAFSHFQESLYLIGFNLFKHAVSL